MKRLSVLLALLVASIVLMAPSVAVAQTQDASATARGGSVASATTPSPSPTPSNGQMQPVQPAEDSTSASDALIITGFTVIAMIGIILLIRAGMRATTVEDDED